MKWKHRWQDLDTGTPIIPYAHLYIKYATEALLKNNKAMIVEIGVYDGCSARIFFEIKESYPKARLFLIDPKIREKARELAMVEKNCWLIEARAEDIVETFEDESIDLLHVDHDPHTYESQRDMHLLYVPKLKKGGIMIVHDFTERYGCYQYGMEYLVNKPEEWETEIPEKHSAFPETRPLIARKLF